MYNRLLKLPKDRSLFLFGPRGSGKSSLIKGHIKSLPNNPNEIIEINLLSSDVFNQFRKRPSTLEEIISSTTKLIFIDEVQRIPALLEEVHKIMEEKGIHFILTGSSSRKLKRGGANLLAGRARTFLLDPFSFLEIEGFNLDRALHFGMLPKVFVPNLFNENEIWSDDEINHYLLSYVDTYLKEEILEEQLVRKINPFRDFLEIIAQSNGKIIVYEKIAKEIEVSSETVKTFFDILEDTLLGFRLEPYNKSVRKRQLKSPKFYLFDCGIKRAMERSLVNKILPSTGDYGDAFEHFVICEIMKLIHLNVLLQYKLFFLRTRFDSEINLIVERPNAKNLCIEIKSSTNLCEDTVKKLEKFQSDMPESEFIIFSRDKYIRKIRNITIYPWAQGIQKFFRFE